MDESTCANSKTTNISKVVVNTVVFVTGNVNIEKADQLGCTRLENSNVSGYYSTIITKYIDDLTKILNHDELISALFEGQLIDLRQKQDWDAIGKGEISKNERVLMYLTTSEDLSEKFVDVLQKKDFFNKPVLRQLFLKDVHDGQEEAAQATKEQMSVSTQDIALAAGSSSAGKLINEVSKTLDTEPKDHSPYLSQPNAIDLSLRSLQGKQSLKRNPPRQNEYGSVDSSPKRPCPSVEPIKGYIYHYSGIEPCKKEGSKRYLRFLLKGPDDQLFKFVSVEQNGEKAFLDDFDKTISRCFKEKIGIEVRNYRQHQKSLPIMFINNLSTTLKSVNLDYEQHPLLFSLTEIKKGNILSDGARVDFKCKCRLVTDCKNVKHKDVDVLKQVVLMSDEQESIRFVLCGGAVDQVKEGKTYLIENAVLKGVANRKPYVETRTDQEDQKTEIKETDEKLDAVCLTKSEAKEIIDEFNKEIVGKVIKVKDVKGYKHCTEVNCQNYQLKEVEAGMGECPKCKTSLKLCHASLGIVVEVVIEADDNERHVIPFFKNYIEVVYDFSKSVNFDKSLLECVESDSDKTKIKSMLVNCPTLRIAVKHGQGGKLMIAENNIQPVTELEPELI